MRLVPLECGWLSSELSGLMEGGTGRARLPIPSWLVLHPRGTLVFDTGLHRELQHDTSRIGSLGRVFDVDFSPGEELSARLVGAGVDPTEVDLAVFSHLHFDHCGGTELLPDARLVVQLGTGPVVLTADCVYFRRQLDEMRTPPFGADVEQQRASMRMLAGLEGAGCRLLFGHDAEQWATLPAGGLT